MYEFLAVFAYLRAIRSVPMEGSMLWKKRFALHFSNLFLKIFNSVWDLRIRIWNAYLGTASMGGIEKVQL